MTTKINFQGGYRGYKIETTVTISKNSRISQNELRSHLFNNFYSTIFIAHISRICIYNVIFDSIRYFFQDISLTPAQAWMPFGTNGLGNVSQRYRLKVDRNGHP